MYVYYMHINNWDHNSMICKFLIALNMCYGPIFYSVILGGFDLGRLQYNAMQDRVVD